MAINEVLMIAGVQGSSLRMGIMGIERSIEKSQQETSKNVSAVSTGDCSIRIYHNICYRHSGTLMLSLIKYGMVY